MKLALDQLFTAALRMPAAAGLPVPDTADEPPPTALPMPPAIPEEDEDFFAEDDAPGEHDHGE